MIKNTVIRVSKFNEYDFESTLKLELAWDADLNDWVDAIKTILTWMTFGSTTIDKMLDEYYKEGISKDYREIPKVKTDYNPIEYDINIKEKE